MAGFWKSSLVALVIAVSIGLARTNQCANNSFVAQVFVGGCALFVHDTGAADGPHLEVEPVLCVTESLEEISPNFDFVIKKSYVRIPVTLRDDAMLLEVEQQLRHLSPKSVQFMNVNEIRVSIDSATKFYAMGFDWTAGESVGFVRLGCEVDYIACSAAAIAMRLRRGIYDDLKAVQFNVKRESWTGFIYQLRVRGDTLVDLERRRYRYPCVQTCEPQELKFVKSVSEGRCSARVYQRSGSDANFLIEPLLCYYGTEYVVSYDYGQDAYYVKLDVVLQKDVVIHRVRDGLPEDVRGNASVSFMSLWRAQIYFQHFTKGSPLKGRFVLGPLMVSDDGKNAQLRLYCLFSKDCLRLKSSLGKSPDDFWRHIRWFVTSLVSDKCSVEPTAPRFMRTLGVEHVSHPDHCLLSEDISIPCRLIDTGRNGRPVVWIQGQRTGEVSFNRNWTEYENGFGSHDDFWLGLHYINLISINGATLIVDMKTVNGTELHVEYAGFKVGNASTNYLMTYLEMLRDRSNVKYDALAYHNKTQFSTIDRDNDHSADSCTNHGGDGSGWWFNNCQEFNPNGVHPSRKSPEEDRGSRYMSWRTFSATLYLLEVRMSLQI